MHHIQRMGSQPILSAPSMFTQCGLASVATTVAAQHDTVRCSCQLATSVGR